MQKLLREFLYFVCKFNFHPLVSKIGSKENEVADFLSRVYDATLIDDHFESLGYKDQKKLDIPADWFLCKADW